MSATTLDFAVPARDERDAHRPIPTDVELRSVLARYRRRKLSRELTFTYGRSIYRTLETERRFAFPHATINLIITLDGELIAKRNGRTLPIEELRERPKLAPILDAKQLADLPRKPPYRPAPDHPWKNRAKFFALGTAHPTGDISNLQAGDITDLR